MQGMRPGDEQGEQAGRELLGAQRAEFPRGEGRTGPVCDVMRDTPATVFHLVRRLPRWLADPGWHPEREVPTRWAELSDSWLRWPSSSRLP
jgi:hypothetical protein